MRVFLFSLCVLSCLAGGFITVHDSATDITMISAFVLFQTGATCLVGSAIVDAIKKLGVTK